MLHLSIVPIIDKDQSELFPRVGDAAASYTLCKYPAEIIHPSFPPRAEDSTAIDDDR